MTTHSSLPNHSQFLKLSELVPIPLRSFLLGLLLFAKTATISHAAPLDPDDFTSLGTLNLAGGDFVIDTSAMTITDVTGGGSTLLFTGVSDDQGGTADYLGGVWVPASLGIPEIAVFTFDDINLQATANISITGNRALALLSQGDATIDTPLSVDGESVGEVNLSPAGLGGAGGFRGADSVAGSAPDRIGEGPGGGGPGGDFFTPPTSGGGGFGGASLATQSAAISGLAYGDLDGPLQGGSGGGGSIAIGTWYSGGGGGGGAIEIGAISALAINADITANGGDGGGPNMDPSNTTTNYGSSGSGSGGGIRLHAEQVLINANLQAMGGNAWTNRIDTDFSPLAGGGRIYVRGAVGMTSEIVAGQPATLSFADFPRFDVSPGELFDPNLYPFTLPVPETVNYGVLTIQPRLTIVPANETLVYREATEVSGPDINLKVFASSVRILDGGTVDIESGLTLDEELEFELEDTTARIIGTGPLINDGAVAGTGSIEVAFNNRSGGTVDAVNDELVFTQAAANDAGGRISVVGGRLEFPGDGIANDDGLVNEGTLNLIDATLAGDVRSPAGSTVNVAGTTVFEGLFSGAVSFSGTSNLITFSGGYSPGDSPAVVSFGGSLGLSATNTLVMELGGPDAGGGYDQLQVADSLEMGGTLEVVLLSPFQPLAGQSFDLFDFASTSGSFANISLPPLSNGLTWDSSRLASEGIIEVVGTTNFASEFPSLLPNDDDNSNDRSNFLDYALADSPTGGGPFVTSPGIDGDLQLSLSQRNNATDLVSYWEKRADLGSGDWLPMEQGVDYLLDQQIRTGDQDTFILDLLIDPGIDPIQFFRQRLEAAP
ncbi:hypothetical protein [Haloferula sp.]|uniref:hypothetical protein n=1 Tax=Haloferula sp. TaxID=2497595 RepID=UPI00329BD8CB